METTESAAICMIRVRWMVIIRSLKDEDGRKARRGQKRKRVFCVVFCEGWY